MSNPAWVVATYRNNRKVKIKYGSVGEADTRGAELWQSGRYKSVTVWSMAYYRAFVYRTYK